MADAKISALPELTIVDQADLLAIVEDPAGTPITKKITVANLGKAIQTVFTVTGEVATGTTTIPFDNSIPQITEGVEYMTLAITPKNANNILVISVEIFLTSSLANWLIVALFQDATVNALRATAGHNPTNTAGRIMTLKHAMVAGTISATTFRVRAGTDGAATTTFNGQSGGRIFGGVMGSSIVIREYIPN